MRQNLREWLNEMRPNLQQGGCDWIKGSVLITALSHSSQKVHNNANVIVL